MNNTTEDQTKRAQSDTDNTQNTTECLEGKNLDIKKVMNIEVLNL